MVASSQDYKFKVSQMLLLHMSMRVIVNLLSALEHTEVEPSSL